MTPRSLRPCIRTWLRSRKIDKYALCVATIVVACHFLALIVFVKLFTGWNSRREAGKKFYLVATSTCMIPDLTQDEEDILRYIHPVEAPHCLHNQELSPTSSNLTYLQIPDLTLEYYDLKSLNQLSCCYRSIRRPPSDHPYPDDTFILEKGCHKFKNLTEVKHEFIHVTCNLTHEGKNKMLQDIHAFIPSMPNWSEFSRSISRDLSVLILGIDSMSRLNLERQMPKTSSLLRSMGAVQMLGFTKVGEDTFENVLSFLTGLTIPELKLLCWPNESSPFDNCPFIWKKFSDAGYYTAFAEDASDTSMFNRGMKGFVEPPTDYYLRPYFLFGDHIFASPPGQCYGPKLKAEKLLEYISKFADKKLKKYFGVFWETSLTRNELNYPEITDEIMDKFIGSIRSKLQNTVLVFMSVHGTRIGEFAETYQGYLENRLPLLSFVFPKWFQDDYKMAMKNLKRNSRRLTTHFDLHETLLDIMDLTSLGNDYLKLRKKEIGKTRQTGMSLFLPVPEGRTCNEAGISPHWCTCNLVKKMTSKHYIVYYLSRKLVEFVNSQVKNLSECSSLQLLTLRDVRIHISPRTNDVISYYLIVETVPGNAVFGGTFLNQDVWEFGLKKGNIERLNNYGNQSYCIKHQSYYYHPFCYCKQQNK